MKQYNMHCNTWFCGFHPVQNGDGTIDFREYVIGVNILCRPANTEDVLQMAFQVVCTKNNPHWLVYGDPYSRLSEKEQCRWNMYFFLCHISTVMSSFFWI